MIEELINFKLALIQKKSKNEVIRIFNEYSKKYDELGGEASVMDKSEYRDLKHDFVRYISSSRGNNGI